MSCVRHYADPSLAQLAKVGKALKDKAVDKAPKFVSAIRQEIIDTLGNFTKAEHVAVTAEGAQVTVTAKKETHALRSVDKTKGSDFGQKSQKTSSNIKENKYTRPDVVKMTAKQAAIEAEKLGFEKTNYYYKGQPIFKKGNRYISPDVDVHNGGVWKMADSVKNLEHKSTRMGTYDKNLNRIRD
jgi:hypothetical protein